MSDGLSSDGGEGWNMLTAFHKPLETVITRSAIGTISGQGTYNQCQTGIARINEVVMQEKRNGATGTIR